MGIPPCLGARPRDMAFASWPMGTKKKRKRERHTRIHHFIPKLYFAGRPIVTAICLLSQLKQTKCKLKCLRSADKLSHKLYSETFKIWYKHSTLGDTLLISDVSLCRSTSLWNNTAKCLPSLPSYMLAHLANRFSCNFLSFFPPDVTGHCIRCRYQQWILPTVLLGSNPEPGVVLIIGPQCGFFVCTWLTC